MGLRNNLKILLIAGMIFCSIYLIKRFTNSIGMQAPREAENVRGMDAFVTLRMNARRIHESDRSDLYLLLTDSQVTDMLAIPSGDQEAEQELQQNLDHWDKYGYGFWVFYAKGSGQFIGRAGLRRTNESAAISYAIMPEFWGKGLATEMAQAIIKVGFEQLDLENIVGYTYANNQASQSVLKKLGFKLVESFEYDGKQAVKYMHRRS